MLHVRPGIRGAPSCRMRDPSSASGYAATARHGDVRKIPAHRSLPIRGERPSAIQVRYTERGSASADGPDREHRNAAATDELSIRAFHLEKDMTMRVRMADQRAVHIEQCDPAEIAVHDTQSSRHLSLRSGVGLPGNEPPLDFVEKDQEGEAENRDVQQADIHGVDRRNLPLNHKADAVIGATSSEDRNQDGPASAARFIPATSEGSGAPGPD